MAATRTIELKTEIPGPALAGDRRAASTGVVARPLALTFPVVAESARGVTLTDVDGNTFIDFAGGVGSLNVGHSHPDVVAAAQEQLERFSHTDFTVVPYEVYVTLAERLAERVPISGPVKAGFFNAGTEAVENAVKFARAYTKRPAIIAFEGGFHGRTLMSLSLTSKTHPYKAGLGPFAPEVYRVPFPYAYRGITTEDALAALERAFKVQVAAETRRGDRVRAGAGRGRLRRRAARVRRRACAASATSTGSCSWPTRCRPASAAPAASSRWSTSASSPTWSRSPSRSRRACRSRACSAARRSWTRPSRAASAAPTSATPSRRRRRSRCST